MKILCLLLVASACRFAEAKRNTETEEFDEIDSEFQDFKYAVDPKDLDKLKRRNDDDSSEEIEDKIKTKLKKGFKKNNSTIHDNADWNKFVKELERNEEASDEDDLTYDVAKAVAGNSVKINGKEDRKYKKGTKTKGFHRVHHKDEYEKNKEFFNDDVTKGSIKKVGMKVIGVQLGSGAWSKKARGRHHRKNGQHGKIGYLDEGYTNNAFKESSESRIDSSLSDE